MDIAVVTGASSGMGREFVYEIAKRYKNLDEIWVIARREDNLKTLCSSIKTVKIRVIACDITRRLDFQRYKDLLSSKRPRVRVLVNSAGIGVIGNLAELPASELSAMCELNCTALTQMIRITIPYMAGTRSAIINLASAAAFVPQPAFSVYAATKSYVLSLSLALKKELRHFGISVTAVCPGPVNTEFFDKAEHYHSVKLYKKLFMANKKKVVIRALDDAEKGKSMSVYGFTMKALRVISKILPTDFIVRFI